jgi:hypothetical protein
VVVAVLPLVIGGISVGMLSVFKLQSSVSSRLSDTADAQVIKANYQNDVQSASYITTSSTSTPQCGTGLQLLGLESNLDTSTGNFQTVVSYVEKQVGSTYSLVRQYCANENNATPAFTSTIANNLSGGQAPPVVTCSATATSCNPTTAWTDAKGITSVAWTINAPNSNFTYTLVSVPVASTAVGVNGTPITPSTPQSCGYAGSGTGTYAQTLCLVDFSNLGAAQLLVASTGCLNMAVSIYLSGTTTPSGYTLTFCMSITGGAIAPSALPTYPEAFLGNSLNGQAFYTGIAGYPALYQSGVGQVSTISFNYISLIGPNGVPATGWQAVSADAESTDTGESITWTTGTNGPPLTVIPNTPTSVAGNACMGGLTGSGTQTVQCVAGPNEPSSTKTGTAMVSAVTPTSLIATLVGGGRQAIAFGLLIS